MDYLLLLSFLLGLIKVTNGIDFYTFSPEDHEGNAISLEKYRGKVTLVVNVASHCGYTEGTYRALTRLHDILSYGGFFSVMAFPCDQFGNQEPGDIEEIVTAMRNEYQVEFPIFNKINVLGADASPAFKNLIEQSSVVPDWNFYKYLVNASGEVINSWGTRTTIEEMFDAIQAAIEKAKKIHESTDTLQGSTETSEESQEKKKEDKDEL